MNMNCVDCPRNSVVWWRKHWWPTSAIVSPNANNCTFSGKIAPSSSLLSTCLSVVLRRMIGDLMCFLGMLGIVLMVIESEVTFNGVDHKDSTFSLLIKATITFSSIILVGLVFYYHRIDLNLYCVDNSIDDWRIALTRTKICSIIFEAFVCIVHPIPGHFIIEWSSQYVKKVENNFQSMSNYRSAANLANNAGLLNSTSTTTMETPLSISTNATVIPRSYVPIDVILSLPSKSLADHVYCWSHVSFSLSLSSSVFPLVSGVPFTLASFSFGSRCFVAILGLSQSSVVHLSIRHQVLHSTATCSLSDNILYQFIFHRQLGNACMWFQWRKRSHVHARLHMAIYHFVYHHR